MLIHWYCRKLLKMVLKRIPGYQRYHVKHKYPENPDSYLFEYRGYKKIVRGCCCKSSAAYLGFTSWLERNMLQTIKKRVKRDSKIKKSSGSKAK